MTRCVELVILSRDKFFLARKAGASKTELSFTCLLSWSVVARSPGCSLIEGRFEALILGIWSVSDADVPPRTLVQGRRRVWVKLTVRTLLMMMLVRYYSICPWNSM